MVNLRSVSQIIIIGGKIRERKKPTGLLWNILKGENYNKQISELGIRIPVYRMNIQRITR